MIQDIYPHIFNNSYNIKTPNVNDYIVIVKDNKILIKQNNDCLCFPTFRDLTFIPKYTFLLSLDDNNFFRISNELESEFLNNDYTYVSYRVLINSEPQHLVFCALVALNLCEWYDNNRYCGRCGSNTVPDIKERMLFCPKCNNQIYPRINPVVIVAVTDDNKLLLTSYKGNNNYALVAGFAEIGESIEDTVRREVFEETGIHVKNIKFYKSQPWPLSGSLLFGFFCELDGPSEIVLQEDELGFAGWLDRDEISLKENTKALTAEMINNFIYKKV